MNFSFPFPARSSTPNEPIKLLYSDPTCASSIAARLQTYMRAVPFEREIVIVCVGTDRSTGDALGPLVGSKLEHISIPCYGTLDEPVHAMNLPQTIETIQSRHNHPYMIAVDACLGQTSSIGCIQLGEGPVKPGAGVHKELPPVGNIHITGIVNVGGFMEYFVLQNTRLNLVMRMADVIANSLHGAVSVCRPYSSCKA